MTKHRAIKNTIILGSLVFACKNMVSCMPTVYDDGVINITIKECGCQCKRDRYQHDKRQSKHSRRYYNGQQSRQKLQKKEENVTDKMLEILKPNIQDNLFKVLSDNCEFVGECILSSTQNNIYFSKIHLVLMCNELNCILNLRQISEENDDSKIVLRKPEFISNNKFTKLRECLKHFSSDAHNNALGLLYLIRTKKYQNISMPYLLTARDALINSTRDDPVVKKWHIDDIVNTLFDYGVINQTILRIINACKDDNKQYKYSIHILQLYIKRYIDFVSCK